MKIIAIVRDNAGAFHCAFVKNPDLFRREVAAKAGGASLAYASVLVMGANAQSLIDQLQQKVLPRFDGTSSLQHDIGFLAAASWTVAGRPLLKAQTQRMWRGARKAMGILACQRLLQGLKVQNSDGVDHV